MKLRRDKIDPARAEGVYASIITPRRNREIEVDFGAMLEILDFVAQRGASGVVLFGTTGEFLHFTIAERARFVGLASKRSRVPVLVNVSHSTLEGAAALAEEAAGAGAAGVVLTPPYFYRYDAETIRAFFLEVASRVASQVPVYLDNHPLTGNALPVELAAGLLSSGVFAGIEESSGDWNVLGQLIALPVEVLCGDETLLVRARRAGAAGAVSGLASAVPELISALDRAALANDDPAVDRLTVYLNALLDWVNRFPAPVVVRQACALRGIKTGDLAVPLGEEKRRLLDEFNNWFREWVKDMERVSNPHLPQP